MLKNRLIPCLLIRNGSLVKTRKFANPSYIGDPINAIKIFNEKEVDELMVFDITASRERREPDYDRISQLAGECFMPLGYGGGIRTIDQARRLFALGVEKVSVQTAALQDLTLITRLADQFGSQSILVSVDIKRNWRKKPELFASARGGTVAEHWKEFMVRAVEAGAGEVILNAVDRDGEMGGMDLSLIHAAATAVSVPVTAVGGVGSLNDIKAAVTAGASAVGAGAFFMYHGPHRAVLITYPRYEDLERLLETGRQNDAMALTT